MIELIFTVYLVAGPVLLHPMAGQETPIILISCQEKVILRLHWARA